MKCTLTFLFSFFVLLLSGQSSGQTPIWGLKWTPTSLVNPNTPTFLLGAEVWFSPSVYLQGEIGFPSVFPSASRNETKREWYYRKYKLGFRYLVYDDPVFDVIIGIDGFSIPQSFRDFNGTSPHSPNVYYRYEEAEIRKDAWGLTGVFGFRFMVGKQVFLETYGGLGFKKMNVVHLIDLDNATLMSGTPFTIDFISWTDYDRTPGKIILPYVDLGLKIGFVFGNKRNE